MDLTKLNGAAKHEVFLPSKKMSELIVKKHYAITKIRKVTTRFGPRIVASLENEFTIFIPERVSKILIEDATQMEKLM